MDHMKMTINVTVTYPNSPQPIEKRIDISEYDWREFFRKLPRERDLPIQFDHDLVVRAQKESAELKEKRAYYSNFIGNQLAQAVVEAIESRDEQMGYSPEDWSKMHKMAATT